jgi:hypothetical protein
MEKTKYIKNLWIAAILSIIPMFCAMAEDQSFNHHQDMFSTVRIHPLLNLANDLSFHNKHGMCHRKKKHHRHRHSSCCYVGVPGPQGLTGLTGIQGPTGPGGNSGFGLGAFANASQAVTVSVDSGEDLFFDDLGITNNIIITDSTFFTVMLPGNYYVYFSLISEESMSVFGDDPTLTVNVNGTPATTLPTFSLLTGSAQQDETIILAGIVSLNSNDVITLQYNDFIMFGTAFLSYTNAVAVIALLN